LLTNDFDEIAQRTQFHDQTPDSILE